MVNYTLKKDYRLPDPLEAANFYQRNFALALLNWEINRQEERLTPAKVRRKANH